MTEILVPEILIWGFITIVTFQVVFFQDQASNEDTNSRNEQLEEQLEEQIDEQLDVELDFANNIDGISRYQAPMSTGNQNALYENDQLMDLLMTWACRDDMMRFQMEAYGALLEPTTVAGVITPFLRTTAMIYTGL